MQTQLVNISSNLALVIAMAYADPAFRAELCKDPNAAAKKYDFSLSEQEIAQLKRLDVCNWASKTMNELDARIKASVDPQPIIHPIPSPE